MLFDIFNFLLYLITLLMLMFILSPFSSFFTYNFSLLLYLAHLFTQTWSILQVINSMPLFIFHIMFGKFVTYLFVIWQFLSYIRAD